MSDRANPPIPTFPPAAAWWSDASGSFVALSPRWEEFTGRELVKELGAGWVDGVHPDDLVTWESSFRAALESGSEFRCDLRLRVGLHWAWVRMHGLPQRDADGHFAGFAGSATDVSDLKRASGELDELLQAAAHDLGTPLRNLRHVLEQLDAGTRDAEPVRRARDLARALEHLLHDLLEYSAAGRTAPRLQDGVDPAEVLGWARANLEPLIERTRAEIRVGPLPRVKGDPIHLGRVFQNLLSNALLHCGVAQPRIEVSARCEGREVCFSVSDPGVGIPVAAQEAIFRAFYRLSAGEVAGTGMGLAICRRLVEGHGGRIWVDSQPGSGAAFCFTLPAAH